MNPSLEMSTFRVGVPRSKSWLDSSFQNPTNIKCGMEQMMFQVVGFLPSMPEI